MRWRGSYQSVIAGWGGMDTWTSAGYWQGRFVADDTPWELGAPSSVLLEAFDELAKLGSVVEGRRVMVPGCGRGADALELARRGAHVLAIDWTETAITEISKRWEEIKGGSSGELVCVQGDFFQVTPRLVDIVAEHTFFCAIDPTDRQRYAEQVAAWIRPAGHLIGNFFILSEEDAHALPGLSLSAARPCGGVGGPPFVTTARELETLLRPWFVTIDLRQARSSEPSRRPGMEWVGIFERR